MGLGFMVPLMIDRAVNKRYCYGGSHKFASAPGREVIKNSRLILEAAGVENILMENGRAAGVQLAHEGRVLRPKAVMSTLDSHSTSLDMVGREHLPADLQEAVDGWTWDKWSFNTLDVAAEERPKYKADDPWIDDAFATVISTEGSWESNRQDVQEAMLAKWQRAAPNMAPENIRHPGPLPANGGAKIAMDELKQWGEQLVGVSRR